MTSGGLTGAPTSSAKLYLSIFLLTIATFMEILDTTVVNVAIPKIAGDLSAAPEETAWVIGAYLVANAIILPISGWLATFFGRKRYYMACVALFIISSFLCGMATDLTSLIVFRIMQGLSGGGLAPSEQAIIADTAPPDKLGRAFSIYAFALATAPVFGPTLGGWITDTYSWHWIFFINVPIGIISLILVHFFVHESEKTIQAREKARSERKTIDWQGILLFAIGIGALELFLERGPREDWFESDFILVTALVAFVALIAGIGWELAQKHPAVDLQLFKHRNFAGACVLIFAAAMISTGSVFLVPFMAQTLLGYNTMTAGMIGVPSAIVQIIMIPTVGYFLDKIDPRKIILLGLAISILALWHLTTISLDVDFYYLAQARAYQSFGLAFLAVSINTAAYADVPPEKNNGASALLNLARNMGGSLSIALVTTTITQRTQLHINNFSYHLTNYNPNFVEAIKKMATMFEEKGFSAVQAADQSMQMMWEIVIKQAGIKAILDAYYIFIILSVLVLPIVFLLKSRNQSNASNGH